MRCLANNVLWGKQAIGLAGSILVIALSCFAQPKTGDIIFQTDFEGADTLRAWGAEQNQNVRLALGFQSARSLQVERPANTAGSASVHLLLPIARMRGARLACCAMVRANGVTPQQQPWNGIKFMLHITTPSGALWPQRNNLFGTFDWKRVQFKVVIPADATAAELVLGLEAVNGRAQFDDLKITVAHGPRARPATPPAGPVFTGHAEPRLRGAMISPDITPESLRVLGQEWNANLIRWQLIRYGPSAQINTAAGYDAWLEGALGKLDAALPLCERYGVRVVLDLHSPFGGTPTVSGYVGTDTGLFANRAAQDKFVADWERMARRYRDSPVIWGYDLANEPVEDEVAEGCDDWQALATRAARAVRAADARHAIIVEPTPGGGPEGLENLEPLPVPGVVYSVHMYLPHQFTHQGVYGGETGIAYPGMIAGKLWDKAALRHVLQPVRDWQRDYGVQIYIGEFSAIRWAPDDSAYRYLKDCIELFEEFGWDWSYHAFREWSGWSVEHGQDEGDATPSKTQTSREKLLRQWYGQNLKAK
ncbi:MAG: glycoside hydrolase family 5 protein [Limisphaerales bacterium]